MFKMVYRLVCFCTIPMSGNFAVDLNVFTCYYQPEIKKRRVFNNNNVSVLLKSLCKNQFVSVPRDTVSKYSLFIKRCDVIRNLQTKFKMNNCC